MLSATLDHPTITYQMPPSALQTPQAAEEWARGLPPQAQQMLVQRAQAVLQSISPAARTALGRYLASTGVAVPPELSYDSLGDAPASGAAGYAGAIGALIGAGATLYTAHEADQSQQQMYGNALASNQAIAQIGASSYTAATQAMADAATTAAAISGQTALAKSELHSQTIVAIMPWLGGIAALGVVGWGVYAYMKRKRK